MSDAGKSWGVRPPTPESLIRLLFILLIASGIEADVTSVWDRMSEIPPEPSDSPLSDLPFVVAYVLAISSPWRALPWTTALFIFSRLVTIGLSFVETSPTIISVALALAASMSVASGLALGLFLVTEESVVWASRLGRRSSSA